MKTLVRSRFATLPVFATFSMALAATAAAQSTWNGSNANWSTTTSWTPNGVPAAGANIIIADATTNGMTLDGTTSRSIGSLTFGATGTRATGFTVNTQIGNTLTIAGGIVANGAFPSGTAALTLRGNVTVSTDQTWSVAGSATHNTDQGVFIREVTTGATNRGKLTLDANLTKSGVGQVLFAAIDVLGAGNLVVNDGDLKFNAGASQPLVIGGAGNITVNNAATLAIYRNSGTMSITRPIVMNNTATLSPRNSTVDVASSIAFNGTHTFDPSGTTNLTGAITGSGTVNRSGAGTLSLNGTLTGFSGTLNISAGTTNITTAFGGNLGVSAGSAVVSSTIAGGVNLTGGTTTLAGNVSGTLTLGTGATLGGEITTSGNLSLNGGTLNVNPTTGASLGTSGNLSLTGSNTIVLSANPVSTAPFTVLTYTGTLTGGAANLTLLGGATNYRSSTFDDTTPGVITLAVGSASRTWNTGTVWDINTSPNWLEGDQKFFQLDAVTFGDTGAGTIALTGVLSPSSITVNSANSYEFTAAAGNYLAGAGTLTKNGAATLTLGGVNTFTGNISVLGGVLKPTGNQALGGNGKTITIASGATLDTNGVMNANRDYAAVISGAGVDSLGVIVNSTAIAHQNGFGSLTLAADATIGGLSRWDLRPITAGTGVLNLAGFTLTKLGTNTIAIVDSAATADGSINVNEGILSLTRNTVSGAGSINVNPFATLYFENYSSGSCTKAITVDGGTVRCGGSVLSVGSAVTLASSSTFQCDANLTLTGAIGGAGDLVKTGGSALILAGDATHAGGTTVSAGSLQIGASGTTGTIAGDITNNATVTFDRSDLYSFGNVISGTGSMIKQGAGILTLTGSQTYAGNTAINAGTLMLGGANRLPVTTNLTMGNITGAGMDFNDFSQELRTLAGGGLAGGSLGNSGSSTVYLTISPIGTDGATFSGMIQDAIRVTIIGDKIAPSFTAPRQRFAGTANTYTGGTVIDGATLMARLDGSLGAIPASFEPANITLQNNGTLLNEADFNALTLDANRGITLGAGGGALVAGFNNVVTVKGVISGAAGNTLTVLPNNGTVVLTADNTYAGDTILAPINGTNISRLRIGDGAIDTTGSIASANVINDGQLSFNRVSDLTFGAVISGTGTVTQLGAGNVTLTAVNTYTGNTSVNAGTLTLADNAGMKFAVTDSSATLLGGVGTVTLDGDFTIDTSAVTVTSGTWLLVDVNALTETFGSSFTVAGAGWSETAGVWSKTESGMTWSFDEATGELTLVGNTFAGWMAGFDFSVFPGADLTPSGDADGDGIANAVEFVIGNLPNESKVENLPTIQFVTDPAGLPAGDYLKFSYRRTTASVDGGAVSGAQYDSDLAGTWTNAVDGTAGVEIIATPNALIPGDDVEVYIPQGLAVDGRLMGRLSVVVP